MLDLIRSMTDSDRALTYITIGLIYWSINIFIRKLHTKNDPGDGWFLSPLWLLGWPICFASLIVLFLIDLKDRYKRRAIVYSQRLKRRFV